VWWPKRRASGPTPFIRNVVFDLVEQPLFVFEPVFDESSSVTDLLFVDMNAAAQADLGIGTVPVGDSVRGWLTDLDLLWTAADRAWTAGRAAPYDLDVRRGPHPDVVRSYTIETARDGGYIVQVAAPRTDARLLRDERDRFAATLDALDDGVIVLRPVADGTQVLDARIEFLNAACGRFLRSSLNRSGVVGLGIGEIVERSETAEAIVAAVAAAAGGAPTSLILDNSEGVYPLLALPSVRLAFVGQSPERVIVMIQDMSSSTFAELQSTILDEFGRAVVEVLTEPAVIVRVTDTDLVIDQANPAVRSAIVRELPCTLAATCDDTGPVLEATAAIRRVLDRSTIERHLSLGCSGPLGASTWAVTRLPGNRVLAVAEQPVGERPVAGS
jgi:PAS domain-containing protein